VLRALAVSVALGLGVAAVWLIVIGDAKQTKIGVLLGLWGLLLAAYQAGGVRSQAEIVGLELADLRAEIAGLRVELAATVADQLRLEPTGITRHNEVQGHEVLTRILARERSAPR
jgi:hypothetical protein